MSDRTIEITKTIEAPTERVFHALTDADELARWWPSSADSDPRSGGSFEYRFEFPEEPERDHTYSGAYHEVTQNELVSFPWAGRLGETRVDLRLEPAGDGTALTLVHSGWGTGADWDDAYELHVQGWGFFLGNLQSFLERGEDRRAQVLGMRTAAAV